MKRCRKLGGGVLSDDAQTFFLEKCLNDEVNMAFHLLLCLNLTASRVVHINVLSFYVVLSVFFHFNFHLKVLNDNV